MQIQAFPVISYSEIQSGATAPQQVLDTLAATGFFYLSDVDEVISPQLFKSVQEVSRRFFDLRLETKMRYYIGDSANHRGYVPVTEKGAYGDESIRAYEAFDIGYDTDELPPERRRGYELVGPNQYPEQIGDMAKTVQMYYEANFSIARRILSLFAVAAQLDPEYFEPLITRPASQLRLIHYLPNDVLVHRDDTSMGAHTDYELFTVMYQAAPGLRAYDRATQTWRDMPAFKNTLLVLVGDMLEFLTGGRLRSLLHRVVTTGEERYSFPFFMNLDFETELRPLPHFGGGEERLVVGHHLIGQLYRDFPYIKERIDSGRWPVDFAIPDRNVFEQV